jgi:hypothetical protein
MTPTHRAEAHESELAALTAGIEEALASNCDGITAFVPVELLHGLLHELAARATPPTEPVAPIDMVLYCPNCGMQHIDADESETLSIDGTPYLTARLGWDNPPHRSHLCHGCGHIWRPADVPTNGVAGVKTKGKADSPVSARIAALEASETEPMLVADVARELGVSAVAVCSKLREAGFGNFSVNMAITRAAAKCVRAAFQRAALEAAAVPTWRDVRGLCMRAAEGGYKAGAGRDRSVRSDVLRPIVDEVLGAGVVAEEAAAVPPALALDDPKLQKVFGDAIEGALAFGLQQNNKPPEGHWLWRFWNIGAAEARKAAAVPTSAAVPPDDVLEALDLSPEQFRTEGGAINRAKLRAAIRRPADYLPPEHWLRAAAVPANLQWAEAPERTQWGGGMMEALLALGKDHTLRLYAEKEALHLVPAALGAPPGTAVPVEVVKWLDEIAEMHGQWSNGIYAAHRAAKVRGWLATLQAAEPAEDHMTHAEWNRRYFPSGLTPVPDNAVPYTEPAAKKDTAA